MASRARWPGIPAILLPMLALSSPSWAGGSSSEPVGRRPSSPPHEPGLRARPQSGSFSSLEGWLAAAPGATSEISFKEVPVGDFIAGHYASTHSVSFDSLDKVRETSLFLVDRVGVDGQGPSQLTFSEQVWGVACEYPDGLRIEAYDADQALVFKSEDAGAAGVKGQFFGAIFPEPVKEVIIHDWVNHLVLYDTLYIAYDRADCADEDGDGVSTCDGDCDDAQATTLPGAEELLGDEVDNDCDGEIDEGACEACALSEGPANPDGASLDPQAGASAVLLHLRITNEGNERPLTVTRIEADVTWPQASEGDARLRLAEDAGCDGSVGAGGAAASGVHGAQAFTVSADVPAEGSRCYALVASWDGGGCPGCGVALATVTAGGITAESGGQPVALSGGPVSGALVLPGPALSLTEAPEEPVDPGA